MAGSSDWRGSGQYPAALVKFVPYQFGRCLDVDAILCRRHWSCPRLQRIQNSVINSFFNHSTSLHFVFRDWFFFFYFPLNTYSFVFNRPNVNRVELRRACIQILVSILAVPLHFQVQFNQYFIKMLMWKENWNHHFLFQKSISLKEFGSTSNNNTFFFIRQRLSPILFTALQTESDPFNIHLLLG